MIRGSLVTFIVPGAYGKPRPALVIQSDLFHDHPSVTILPITSELRPTPLFRISVEPTAGNGLLHPSQIMIDKIQTVPINKTGPAIGTLDAALMVQVSRSLALFLGFAG
ncbi:MAG: type II toxin-antitoxin system PemK/MazF family toxin [Spirochaetota bacterium]